MIAQTPNIINKRILQIAVPSIISNITVPLLGLIDVTIVGHLGSAAYIGAIAVGGMLFNIIYWIFGFLRMGTSGMTSQAYGKHDMDEVTRLLLRSVGVGLLIAIILVALQYPIRKLAFTFIQTTEEVEQLATLYFQICIWGAPAMLGLYGFAGWFIGMQNSRFPMYIAITQNIVNIAASLCFVYLFHMKVAGVALGTLTAQYAGFFMALLLWRRYYGKLKVRIAWQEILKKEAMLRFFQVNRDIFLRTLCLVIVTLFFTSAGAAQGEVVLAVNTLLMQLFTLFSYIMDGFAYSGEALVGKYIGADNRPALHRTVRQLFIWGIGLSTGFAISLVARYSWGCSPMKFLSSGKPEITFIGYWLSHLQASPLSYGTEYLSEPLPPGKCFMQCWPPQPVSSSFITPYTSGWEIMPFGWLSSSTYLCAASCRQF